MPACRCAERPRAVVRIQADQGKQALVPAADDRQPLFRVGVDAAMRVLERIDASPSVVVHHASAEDHLAARRWLERLAPKPITYADAVSFAVMESAACRHVLGFDDDFVAAGFERWRVPA